MAHCHAAKGGGVDNVLMVFTLFTTLTDDVTAPENEGMFAMVSDFDAFWSVHAQTSARARDLL